MFHKNWSKNCFKKCSKRVLQKKCYTKMLQKLFQKNVSKNLSTLTSRFDSLPIPFGIPAKSSSFPFRYKARSWGSLDKDAGNEVSLLLETLKTSILRHLSICRWTSVISLVLRLGYMWSISFLAEKTVPKNCFKKCFEKCFKKNCFEKCSKKLFQKFFENCFKKMF